MKVLVTGGTGFAGKNVIKFLIDRNHQPLCIVRDTNKLLNSFDNKYHAKILSEEIKKTEDLSSEHFREIIENNDINTIVHIAAIAREYSSILWQKYYETNVRWTKELALGFINSKIEHNRFIYISSVGVYGTIPKICPANEKTPYNPDGKYHKSKMMAEKELIRLKEEKKLPLVILRPSIMYGVGDYGFLYKLFKLTKKGVYPLTTKNCKIHLLDLDTFAKSIEAVMRSSKKTGSYIYNVANKNPVDMKELLEFIKIYTGGKYISVPSILISFLEYLSRIHPAFNIKFKLINENWYYDVSHIEKDFEVDLSDTYTNLKKYVTWYIGELNGNK